MRFFTACGKVEKFNAVELERSRKNNVAKCEYGTEEEFVSGDLNLDGAKEY